MKKIAYAILFCSIFFNANSIYAQWIQTNGPYGGNIRSIVLYYEKLYAATYGGGVFVSSDNGQSWHPMNAGLTNVNVNALALGGSNLYVGTYGSGVFRLTSYGGKTSSKWEVVNNGLTNPYINALTSGYYGLFAATDQGVFRSQDAGKNWTAVNSGLENNRFTALVANGTNLFVGSSTRGVFRYSDDGNSWHRVWGYMENITSLAHSGTTVFAGTAGHGVYRCDTPTGEGGYWFEKNSTLFSKYVNCLFINGTNMYAGFTGGGRFT